MKAQTPNFGGALREFYVTARNKGRGFATITEELQDSFWPSEIADDHSYLILDNIHGSAQIWLLATAPSSMAIILRPVRTRLKQDWCATFHLETPAHIIKIAALSITK